MKRIKIKSWYAKQEQLPKVIEGYINKETEKAIVIVWCGDHGLEERDTIPKAMIKETVDLPELHYSGNPGYQVEKSSEEQCDCECVDCRAGTCEVHGSEAEERLDPNKTYRIKQYEPQPPPPMTVQVEEVYKEMESDQCPWCHNYDLREMHFGDSMYKIWQCNFCLRVVVR